MYIKQVRAGILRVRAPREAGWVGADPGRGDGGERLPGGPGSGWGRAAAGAPPGARRLPAEVSSGAADRGLVGGCGGRAASLCRDGGARASAMAGRPRSPRPPEGCLSPPRLRWLSPGRADPRCRRRRASARLFTSVRRVFPRRRAPQGPCTVHTGLAKVLCWTCQALSPPPSPPSWTALPSPAERRPP